MNTPVLSIVIVTFNNQREIRKCLKSLRQLENHFQTQLIIIDNRSSDKTRSIIRSMLTMFQHHQFMVNAENIGYTRAVNQGLRECEGRYILTLNPDTEMDAGIFPELFNRIEQDESLGIVSPQFRNSDASIQPSCRRFPRHRDVLYNTMFLNRIFPHSKEFNYWKMGDFDHKSDRFVEQPQGAFLLTHRDALGEIGFLDERFPMFFSDVDWCRRFIDAGWKIGFVSGVAIVHHKGRSVSQKRISLIWSSHVSFSKYFQKYYRGFSWSIFNSLTYLLLMALAAIRTICVAIIPEK
ncbi:MAG: glycosyltransferase family 2 protein [candidate division KSB1 bacterium]|jgi:GT2 family glycosyltransferase|nr:glycosyltransferase family 2 protein [candidate division KSB1 bacterium]